MTCEFETPMFIFWAYPAVIVLSFALAFLVLLRDRRNPVNRNAFYFIFIIALWITNDFAQWVIHDVDWSIFLYKISVFIDLAFLFFLYFIYSFSGSKLSIRNKLLLAVPLLPDVLLNSLGWGMTIVNLETCDFADGPAVFYTYLLDIFYVIWATIILRRIYKNKINPLEKKRQAKVLGFSIWFFLISSMVYWVTWSVTLSAETACYFIICALFFVFLISMATIKHALFEFSLVPTAWLVIVFLTTVFSTILFLSFSPFLAFLLIMFYLLLLLIFWKI